MATRTEILQEAMAAMCNGCAQNRKFLDSPHGPIHVREGGFSQCHAAPIRELLQATAKPEINPRHDKVCRCIECLYNR